MSWRSPVPPHRSSDTTASPWSHNDTSLGSIITPTRASTWGGLPMLVDEDVLYTPIPRADTSWCPVVPGSPLPPTKARTPTPPAARTPTRYPPSAVKSVRSPPGSGRLVDRIKPRFVPFSIPAAHVAPTRPRLPGFEDTASPTSPPTTPKASRGRMEQQQKQHGSPSSGQGNVPRRGRGQHQGPPANAPIAPKASRLPTGKPPKQRFAPYLPQNSNVGPRGRGQYNAPPPLRDRPRLEMSPVHAWPIVHEGSMRLEQRLSDRYDPDAPTSLDGRQVLVGPLPSDVSTSDVLSLFLADVGPVEHVGTRRGGQCVVVTFVYCDAQKAHRLFHNKVIDGRHRLSVVVL